jgi:thiol peroxidase
MASRIGADGWVTVSLRRSIARIGGIIAPGYNRRLEPARRTSMAGERTGAVTMRGNPITLVGPELRPGDTAPQVKLLDPRMQEVAIGPSDRVRIVSVVPSLDTPVCDIQTKRFNQEASKLADAVEILTVSADLPFAQARWAAATSSNAVSFLSDHRAMAFGDAYGTHIKELRLDARAIFVIDRSERIVHAEYVNEVTEQPDYDAAISAAKKAAGS